MQKLNFYEQDSWHFLNGHNFLFFDISLTFLFCPRDNRLHKIGKIANLPIYFLLVSILALLWHLYKLSDFVAMYLKCPGLPRGPQYQFWMSVCLLLVLVSWHSSFVCFLTYWHINRPYSSQILKIFKKISTIPSLLFKQNYINDRCSKFHSAIVDIIILWTVFVAQKTPNILHAKLWNFLANFHKEEKM
jgi:hypothetical protein